MRNFTTSSSALAFCPDTMVWNPANGHCYSVDRGVDNREEAHEVCSRLHAKAHLVDITSAEEYQFIIDTLLEPHLRKYPQLTTYICILSIVGKSAKVSIFNPLQSPVAWRNPSTSLANART